MDGWMEGGRAREKWGEQRAKSGRDLSFPPLTRFLQSRLLNKVLVQSANPELTTSYLHMHEHAHTNMRTQ